MFGTLHCNRQTNDVEFVQRPDGFSKPEKHLACDRCRAKKVKCINQEKGCSRCESLGKTCTFRLNEQKRPLKRRQTTTGIEQRESWPNFSIQSSSSLYSWSSKDGGEVEGNGPGTTSQAFPSLGGDKLIPEHDLRSELVKDKDSNFIPQFNMSLFNTFPEQILDYNEQTSPVPSSPRALCPIALPGTNAEPIWSTVYGTPSQIPTPSLSSIDELPHPLQPIRQHLDARMFLCETEPNTTLTSKDPTTLISSMFLTQAPVKQSCQCLASVVFGVERCEISCHSASRAELDSIVARQKEAINSCRAMLKCGTCMAKRENITLWIFMIEKIVVVCGQIARLYRMTNHDKPAGSDTLFVCLSTDEDSHRSHIRDPGLIVPSSFSYPSAAEPVRLGSCSGSITPTRTGASRDWQELLFGDYEISSITEWNHVVGIIVLLQFKIVMEVIADMKCEAGIILEETQKVKLGQSETRVCELAKAVRCFQMEQ
ncbi:fungal Zn binuclear cluster domain-containing protein [Xylariaceae sp. FL1651]|nr:fungal Zn binuclear cluster domain-containing protein [Xylariaceae sp. FL1651]